MKKQTTIAIIFSILLYLSIMYFPSYEKLIGYIQDALIFSIPCLLLFTFRTCYFNSIESKIALLIFKIIIIISAIFYFLPNFYQNFHFLICIYLISLIINELFYSKSHLWYRLHISISEGILSIQNLQSICFSNIKIVHHNENSYTFELLGWPYQGVHFYFRKRDENLWELIAPKIIAEGFIKDLEKYSGEKIKIREIQGLN